MKLTLAKHKVESVEATPQTASASSTSVAVYTFVIWDHDRNATAIYPRMATLEAIKMMRGKVNEDTAWVVDTSELDSEGFYPRKSSEVR